MEQFTIAPGVELRCFRDGRFKQGCLSIQFVRPMEQFEAGMNALLPSVLLRGTRKHPDLRAVTMVLDDLYGAGISPLVRRVGDVQTTGFYCSFMDERFALDGDRVLEPLVAFLGELLTDSPLDGEGFLPEYVESEKRNLISAIEAESNDKRVYAMEQLLKSMCRGDSFGIPRLGEPERIAQITPAQLYAHHQRVLAESPVQLYYVGSLAPEQVARWTQGLFDRIPRHLVEGNPAPASGFGAPADWSETMEIAQGKLCMGFTTPITNHDPRFAAMQVLNTVYGAGMTSKLFMQVREKQSLCYSIGTNYYGAKGIVLMSAGIDFDKEGVTRQEVLHQLELCKQAEITPEELTAAKEALVSGLRSTYDAPAAMEGYFATAALSGLTWLPEEYAQAVAAVTAEDAARAAQSLELHSIFFLKGAAQ